MHTRACVVVCIDNLVWPIQHQYACTSPLSLSSSSPFDIDVIVALFTPSFTNFHYSTCIKKTCFIHKFVLRKVTSMAHIRCRQSPNTRKMADKFFGNACARFHVYCLRVVSCIMSDACMYAVTVCLYYETAPAKMAMEFIFCVQWKFCSVAVAVENTNRIRSTIENGHEQWRTKTWQTLAIRLSIFSYNMDCIKQHPVAIYLLSQKIWKRLAKIC